MLRAAVFLLVTLYWQLGCAQRCIHSNIQLMTADEVIREVLNHMDADHNQVIGDLELMIEFVGRFDENHDSQISRTEFVRKWHELYRDVPEFADYMFDHFDRNGDNRLDLHDVPLLKSLVDVDGNQEVTAIEFSLFMSHLYHDCVPHSHLHIGPMGI